jgi:hypothetical protein
VSKNKFTKAERESFTCPCCKATKSISPHGYTRGQEYAPYCSESCLTKKTMSNDVDVLKNNKSDYSNRSDIYNKVNKHNKIA